MPNINTPSMRKESSVSKNEKKKTMKLARQIYLLLISSFNLFSSGNIIWC